MKIHNMQDEYENYDSVVKVTDLEHFFDIHDVDGRLAYNLNETLYLKIGNNDSDFLIYTPKYDKQWSLISYDIYKTTRLAWLLMKINEVDAAHMFDEVKIGQEVKYISAEIVQSILDSIRSA